MQRLSPKTEQSDVTMPLQTGIASDRNSVQIQSQSPSTSSPKYAHTKRLSQNFEIVSEELVTKGMGAYGIVYEGYDVQTNEQVVIKKVTDIFENQTNAIRFLREIKLLRILRGHPNLVSLKDIFQPTTADYAEVELVLERGEMDLHQFFNSEQPCNNDLIQYLFYQLLSGVSYLHAAGVIHRDLKPSNILLNSNCDLMICDFGLSRSLEVLKEFQGLPKPGHLFRELTGYVVTRWYRSPELILGLGYGRAVDTWSLGCILAEFLEMQHRNGSNETKHKPLFPGETCYPFSTEGDITPAHAKDQLNMIFDLIGTPSHQDIDAIAGNHPNINQYLKSLEKKPPQIFQKDFLMPAF